MNTIEFTTNPLSEEVDFITRQINQETAEYGEATPFAFYIRDDQGTIIASANGFVIYGTIYTDQLWVHKDHRGEGLARKIMDNVHAYGKSEGCKIATVQTMNFQGAQGFYEKLGYGEDFRREGYVNGSRCVFMKKDLPSRNEEIEKAFIDEPEKLNSTIDLCPYDESWATLYTEQASLIEEAMSDLPIAVSHVGSTSVPGLSAKPIIDIVLEVPDAADEDAYVSLLESAGFILKAREPDWFVEHRLFNKDDVQVNLHVFTQGCSEVQKMIRFRDHLRSHPDDLALYQQKKEELAKQVWEYTQHYADAKSDVIQTILSRMK